MACQLVHIHCATTEVADFAVGKLLGIATSAHLHLHLLRLLLHQESKPKHILCHVITQQYGIHLPLTLTHRR